VIVIGRRANELGGPREVVSLDCGCLRSDCASTLEYVVFDNLRHGDGAIDNNKGALAKVVDHRVVDNKELVVRVPGAWALLLISHKSAILSLWTFLDEIAHYIGKTAIWEVNLITRRASHLITKTIVIDDVFSSAGLQLMADYGPMRVVVTKDKLGDVSDVQIVGEPVTSAVVIELAVFNQDGTVAPIR
jgi:hypothetical protein